MRPIQYEVVFDGDIRGPNRGMLCVEAPPIRPAPPPIPHGRWLRVPGEPTRREWRTDEDG